MRGRLVATAGMALALWAGMPAPGFAEDGHGPRHGGAVGATVDELIVIAREMNPELQVMALEAAAAAAKVEGAGSLMDPKIQVAFEDWGKNRQGGDLPITSTSGTTKKIRVFQELPFWGKRDLRREIAEAGARKASVLKRAVENELVAKVKVAYAEYHQAHMAIDVAKNLRVRMDTLAKLARARYGQALGGQQEVTRAEVEKSLLDTEIARMEAERRNARVRINRLLNRDLGAPLVEEPHPRPVPPAETMDVAALTDRAQRANPQVAAEDAAIEGADRGVALAEKSWYPDFEVGAGAVRREGDIMSYEAMVTMNVPLQWGLRQSEIGEAKAMSAAARQRRRAREVEIGNEVHEAFWSLEAARKVEKILVEGALPQAEIGFLAASKSYELGRAEMLDVLMSEQQLWKTNIDLLKVRLDQQMRLAELEKLIGGDL